MSRRVEDLYLSLGSNIGNREEALEEARHTLSEEIGTISNASDVIETPPWGKTDQAAFLNQVVVIPTDIRPSVLLDAILHMEEELGRVRFEKWGPRRIDIDIILYGSIVYQSDLLEIPHPYMHERRFVLEPLAQLAPDLVHPVLNRTIQQLLSELPDA